VAQPLLLNLPWLYAGSAWCCPRLRFQRVLQILIQGVCSIVTRMVTAALIVWRNTCSSLSQLLFKTHWEVA